MSENYKLTIMKELSIEEKAKAYDKLFVKAQQIYNKENDVLILHTIEDLLPELKESDDERIRKRIIALVNAHGQGMYKDEMLAWLEKQGGQKPAWSEEDDIMVHDIDYALRCQITYSKSRLSSMSSWIYELKDRVQQQQKWKPSDAQIASITCAIRKMKESACYDSELVSLYQDLKKLIEE